MAIPGALISSIFKGLFEIVRPFIAPLLAYFKGRKEGYAKAKADASKNLNEVTNRVIRDRDAAADKRMRNPDSDDDANFRD